MADAVTQVQAPLFAIIGSIDPARQYDPPLRNIDQAQQAAEEIGWALAETGCRVVVYSGASDFLEAHVVRGYVASGKAKHESIRVWHPVNHPAARFSEQDQHKALFKVRPDSSSDWEASFYRSLGEVDGVVLIGGGRSTFITGHIALGFGLPVLAVATFGGRAQQVWATLESAQLTENREQRHVMAESVWRPGASGKACIDALIRMHQSRLQHRSEELARERGRVRSEGRRAVLALALLVATFAMLPIGQAIRPFDNSSFLALVFLSPILAGACGSTVSMLWTAVRLSPLRTVALGAAAGAVAAALYVGAQLAANPNLFDAATAPPFLVLLYAVLIGLIAGLTFEQVYTRLATVDALKWETVVGTRS